MASNHHVPRDLIADLPMDVPPAFYPPPTFQIPQLRIPTLSKYEYNFESERAAILSWEQEKIYRLAMAEEGKKKEEEKREQQLNRNRQKHLEEDQQQKVEVEEKQRRHMGQENGEGSDVTDKSKTSPPYASIPSSEPIEKPLLLRPIPIARNSASTSGMDSSQVGNTMQTQLKNNNNYTLNGLEEFEPRRDLFDILELRSLDDRRELEKLLANDTSASHSRAPMGSTNSLPLATDEQPKQQQDGVGNVPSKFGSSSSTNVLM